jgi:hypothetical protein
MTIMGEIFVRDRRASVGAQAQPGGGAYLECERCQKQKETVSIADQPGGDSGGAH